MVKRISLRQDVASEGSILAPVFLFEGTWSPRLGDGGTTLLSFLLRWDLQAELISCLPELINLDLNSRWLGIGAEGGDDPGVGSPPFVEDHSIAEADRLALL